VGPGAVLRQAALGGRAGADRDIFLDGMVPVRTGLLLVDSLIDGNLGAFRSAFSHIVLPATILGFFSLAYIAA
jgi:peptide/nickel transport system permease protein